VVSPKPTVSPSEHRNPECGRLDAVLERAGQLDPRLRAPARISEHDMGVRRSYSSESEKRHGACCSAKGQEALRKSVTCLLSRSTIASCRRDRFRGVMMTVEIDAALHGHSAAWATAPNEWCAGAVITLDNHSRLKASRQA